MLPGAPAAAQSDAALIGFYDTLACLFSPSSCIPGYPAEAPFVLDEGVASLKIKDGYGRAFSTKPPAQKPGKNASLTSADFYAVVAWPEKPGETGRRGFCADAGGIICFTEDGSTPRLSPEGRCPWEERDGKPAGCEVLY